MSKHETPPNIFYLCDAYKMGHVEQYPKGTELVFSNLTPRKARTKADGTIPPYFVWFGFTMAWKKIQTFFGFYFFIDDENTAIEEAKQQYKAILGSDLTKDFELKLRQLHREEKLPIHVYALPEGAVVDHGIPVMVMWNTKPEFYWVTNFIETILSAELWHGSTVATTASLYYCNFKKYAAKTSEQDFMVEWQGHDFSYRGQTCFEAAAKAGASHLLFFKGSDTNCALTELSSYDLDEQVSGSVAATEHSVMSAGTPEKEFETFERLITEIYPTGIVSIVSDTWDFWNVVTNYLPRLKKTILARQGKVVIRPDSSKKTPVEVIIGDEEAEPGSAENLGLIRSLDKIFGHTINSKGYKVLNPCIGAIYGDSITLDYQERILAGLEKLGYDTTCIVLGIGSFAYQYVTRDTHGIAVKATACIVNGEVREIFKNPKTDDGTKKSLKGFLAVNGNQQDGYAVTESCDLADITSGQTAFVPVVIDGMLNPDSRPWSEIRAFAKQGLEPYVETNE